MLTISPIRRALVPVDSSAAQSVSAPNYDEFQSDTEVWQILQNQPESILRVTMAHCLADDPSAMIQDGSSEALDRAEQNIKSLAASPLVRELRDFLWVYSIESPGHANSVQLGLGGMARTDEIRTSDNPSGTIVRNEGIREPKARGRADLIQQTKSYIGIVNNAVEDESGVIGAELKKCAAARACDFQATDEHDCTHRVWLITDADQIGTFVKLFAAVPCAYVADGNHRSAAAALLGRDEFLTVFFTVDQMRIEPYNRLIKPTGVEPNELRTRLADDFDVEPLEDISAYQPRATHEIGLYCDSQWYRLTPKPSAFDPENAVEVIDADIVQRLIFDKQFDISDARDARLTFVGGNKDAEYLQAKVDSGEYQFAITLAPVTMRQFVDVCQQNRFMPPKSTWFDPKIRSGLVVAMLDD